ncbi:MFS transporter [Blastomyces dermatitidis ER-3]|uniref:MFS transporter n=1 Tax=Ajellomyces dermatitidis (strain ER-3 / ATCC MYA-2586) TaxID=559297 RepID=A0ABP2EPL7_AJEDR|nr:MFS transporter [Blastomyces dermatitidis ER-3]EEQ84194.2 MFS transporter [Blastomyces dermatitidis ER-3]
MAWTHKSNDLGFDRHKHRIPKARGTSASGLELHINNLGSRNGSFDLDSQQEWEPAIMEGGEREHRRIPSSSSTLHFGAAERLESNVKPQHVTWMSLPRKDQLAMFWRSFGGAISGMVGIIRTMIVENIRKKNYQSRAFSILPIGFNIASLSGTVMGDFLADPVTSYPRLFGEKLTFGDNAGVTLLKKYFFALLMLLNTVLMTILLGTVHGIIGQSVSSAFRTVGPVFAWSWYGLGLEIGSYGGIGIGLVAVVSCLGCTAAFWVYEGSGHEIILSGEEEQLALWSLTPSQFY